MANGDIWTVTDCDNLYIRSDRGTASTVLGALRNGDNIIELERDGEWIRMEFTDANGNTTSGWVNNSFMTVTPGSSITVTTTTETDTSAEDYYRSDTDYYETVEDDLFESSGDTSVASSDFVQIKNVAGVFGLPYQFLPSADLRLQNSNNSQNLGYEYAEKIISRIPLLFIAPGKASFMKKFSRSARETVLGQLIQSGGNQGDVTSLNNLLDEDGRYYTFEYDQTRYYQFVNPMCRIAARYLNLQDVRIDGRNLDNINWEEFTRSRIRSLGDFGDFSSIPFYLDSETSISESFSNSTTQSMIASTVNSISDMGKELNFLMGYSMSGTDILSTNADIADSVEALQSEVSRILGSGNMLGALANHLTTVAAGGRIIFPEIWADSSFSRSYNCNFKFVSPDPSPLSIYLNVIVPLLHLIGLVAPQSLDKNPNGYTNPFLVRAIYKGFFNIDMGIITDMSVNKGAECQWTPDGIPTSIEVSITIKDLYQVMSITPTTATNFAYDTLNNTALMDYIANLCGINIFKPEIVRIIDMWKVNNINNRVTDSYRNIWSKIQQNVQNLVMGIYR